MHQILLNERFLAARFFLVIKYLLQQCIFMIKVNVTTDISQPFPPSLRIARTVQKSVPRSFTPSILLLLLLLPRAQLFFPTFSYVLDVTRSRRPLTVSSCPKWCATSEQERAHVRERERETSQTQTLAFVMLRPNHDKPSVFIACLVRTSHLTAAANESRRGRAKVNILSFIFGS
jgi:hypothetical protein